MAEPQGIPSVSAPLLPPELWQDIADVVAAAKTGKVVISIKCGVITGYDITASKQTRWPASESRVIALSDRPRQVQSARQD